MAGFAQLTTDMAGRLEHNTALRWVGRFGDLCYGLVHVVVAVLALRVAFGSPAGELDQRGAIGAIAGAPFGGLLLWVIAVGLFAFGLWQVLAAAVGYRWVADRGKRTRRRLSALAGTVAVWTIATLALRMVLAAPTKSEAAKQRGWTAQLLQLPGGRAVVVVVGLAVLTGAVVLGYHGVKQTFLADLDPLRLRGRARRSVGLLGSIGFVAKAGAFAIAGVLVVIAGIKVDPSRSGGLDSALRTLAGAPYGDVLLVLVSIGLIAYGGYLAVEARYRRD